MPDGGIVGIAYVELRPLMTGFAKATQAELTGTGAVAADLTNAGAASGASYAAGLESGAAAGVKDIKLAPGLLGPNGAPIAEYMAGAGSAAAASLGTGVSEGVDLAAADTQVATQGFFSKFAGWLGLGATAVVAKGEKVAGGLASGISTGLGKASRELGGVNVLGPALGRSQAAINAQKQAIGQLASGYARLGKIALVAGGALALGVGYESVKLATELQKSSQQIAATGDISQAAARKITNAFLSTAGDTYASANEITAAYAAVAGQLGLTAKHALSAGEAMRFMKVSLDLNEATGGVLANTTASLSQVLQAFQLRLSDAAHASDILFNASRLTNTGLAQVVSTVDRLRGRLSSAKPSLADISTLMVDMSKNSLVGGRAAQLISTAFVKLLGGSAAVTEQLNALAVGGGTITALKEKLSALTAAEDAQKASTTGATSSITAQTAAAKVHVAQIRVQIATLEASVAAFGHVTAASPDYSAVETYKTQIALLRAEESKLSAQTAIVTANNQASNAGIKSTTASYNAQKLAIESSIASLNKDNRSLFNAKGQFIGMTKAIGVLHDEFVRLTQKQQIQAATTLFGASAASIMIKIIDQGPKAFEALQAKVEKQRSAQEAAAKMAQTLHYQVRVLGAALVDEADKLGLIIIPKLTSFVKWLNESDTWLKHNKGAASDLAHTIEAILGVAVGLFVTTKVVAFVGGIRKMILALRGLATAEAEVGLATGGSGAAAGIGKVAAGLTAPEVVAGVVAGIGAVAIANKLAGPVSTPVAGGALTQEQKYLRTLGFSEWPKGVKTFAQAVSLMEARSKALAARNPYYVADTAAQARADVIGLERATGRIAAGTPAANAKSLEAGFRAIAEQQAAITAVEKKYPSLNKLKQEAIHLHLHTHPGQNERQIASMVSRQLAKHVKKS